MIKINDKTVCTILVFLNPALILAIRNPKKDAISIGITGRNKDNISHTGYTMTDGL